MKLIDPKAAKEYAETALADPILQMAVRTVLDNAPGMEIVHCGECRMCGKRECPMSGTPGVVAASDFCSYGERKTDV